MTHTILIAAGGTGGHLFPAEALAAELGRRGHVVELATDERADRYGRAFPARAINIVDSATFKGRGPLAIARTVTALVRGTIQALRLVRRIRPQVVIGFGGYPTFPPLIAAQLSRIPTILHEQNAVMGRANRVLAARVTRIALSFPATGLMRPALRAKAVHTGNPVRDMVISAARVPYAAPSLDGTFRLLVFGGSQGARFFSEAVPPAVALLAPDVRARLQVVQQARAEDAAAVTEAYAQIGVAAEVAPFFIDLPARIAGAHLVVCRSGASSVGELSVIGRPSILVPLPGALDQDQAANAAVLAAAGGAWPIRQAELTPARLAEELTKAMADPEQLIDAAAAARAAGRPDAVQRLADLVEEVAAARR
ncbi:undecaprenyldiphospho-muramoylpentapeptide beta-N-acetylglucosaminyltransferase [Siculibacillus lacustris]|uniref:UDP-N-acetylglucosamine--N-acetylmuramyl-(pentapeptide) pyrophosphoryl-undecaprenol N-acetylglucosamine transferase n=1 Tax=Siculibacillus lacustris TaxID=1549641 RepID=A0A4Q9VT29_9HYPH|nr:undecaprenyldiphospho-muramoylpentapeptide beta-N-acetylglucosaminyltransferase [Siculibacillus lacustris]TBW38709.1 undecaprenyldiphospho-muramoylpentapeptide beta-N-acetylglucosaminyltransferase [Siculibacillus lacustris]